MTKSEMLALARMRMAHGGKTLVPLVDAAKICDVHRETLRVWVREGRVPNEERAMRSRENQIIVDLGAVLKARESSTLCPEGSPISYRDIAVMRLVAAGLSNQEIADRIGRTANTVSAVIDRAYEKTGIHSRVGVVVKCLRLGLFTLDEVEDLAIPMKRQKPAIV